MSKIEVNKIGPQCGTTLTVGCGAGQTVTVDANTVTIGRCGGTVALASGASQTGFGRTGTVDWQTSSIKTSDFTVVDGQGFFVDTNGGAVIATLPTGSAGSIVSLQDYRNTFDTASCTVQTAGSQKINGGTAGGKVILNTEGEGITLVYIDSTVGWRSIQDNVFSDESGSFITATGGTVTTDNCGACRIHTFTGPGTFCVSAISTVSANNQVSYIVVAGGGGGGVGDYAPSVTARAGGGGGAGGFREDKSPVTPYTASPLDGAGNISVTASAFPIAVGGGGAAGVFSPAIDNGSNGAVSTFSTITSTGGGGGESAYKASPSCNGGNPGGSGGGGAAGGGGASGAKGNGNTPSVSPAQGFDGGGPQGTGPGYGGSGGGGAGAVGVTYLTPFGNDAGNGGAGVSSSISGSSVTRSGGGGGGGAHPTGTGGSGGSGGGGTGGSASPVAAAGAGTANTGGGGGAGGGFGGNNHFAGAGGSGVVIIRYKIG